MTTRLEVLMAQLIAGAFAGWCIYFFVKGMLYSVFT